MYYLDTSVVVPLYVNEAKSSDCQQFINTHKSNLALSRWTIVEVYSAFSLLKRTGVLSPADAALLSQTLERQVIVYFSILNPSIADFLIARDCLSHHSFALNLRAADALHVALAKNQGLELVTLDANMAKSAKTLGVKFTLI
jgi:uncharacterized protein